MRRILLGAASGPVVLEIFSGPPPASCGAADTGVQLAALTLPTPWMAPATGGEKHNVSTWTGVGAATGVAGHFRLKSGTITHIQGTVSAENMGGDLQLTVINIDPSTEIVIPEFIIDGGHPSAALLVDFSSSGGSQYVPLVTS